jgi:hypothetical protein
MGKDPVYLVQKETMPWELYAGGWTGIADASKQFHNFPKHPDERKFLGCIHPVTNEQLVYAGLPMGTTNSPPIACRINNSALRALKVECALFDGEPQLNTWGEALRTGNYDGRNRHGGVLMGSDGLPAVLIFCIVDDYFIHGPTKGKCQKRSVLLWTICYDWDLYVKKLRRVLQNRFKNFAAWNGTLTVFLR